MANMSGELDIACIDSGQLLNQSRILKERRQIALDRITLEQPVLACRWIFTMVEFLWSRVLHMYKMCQPTIIHRLMQTI